MHRLSRAGIVAVHTSPRERARDTAAPLAARLDLPLHINSDIDEIDFGDWTGRSFDNLAREPTWPVWVHHRSVAHAPNGETFSRVQERVITAIERLRAEHANGVVALVTHGDVIKAAIAHVLGLSLNHLERFDIAPASISILAAEDGWAQMKLVNDVGHLPAPG